MDTGEGSDALMRGRDDTEQGRDGIQKLSQVVQVGQAAGRIVVLADEDVIELLFQSCTYHSTFEGLFASCLSQGNRHEKSEQMGEH